MHFQDLDEDILPRILAQLDVHTVLRVGQVNRLLHALTLRRELWLALISDLAFHGIIDPPSTETLRKFNTQDLIYEVKRTVAGPRTWSPISTSPPKVARVLTLPLPGTTTGRISCLRVLPGGQYIAVLHVPYSPMLSLEIWSIARRECVWLWQALGELVVWSIDVVPGGVFANVLVHPILVSAPVIVYRVSLETGDATCLFEQDLPFEIFWHSHPHILGDYFLAVIPGVESSLSGRGHGPAVELTVLLLVNLQEKTYVALKCDATKENLFDIRHSFAPGTHHRSPVPTLPVQGCHLKRSDLSYPAHLVPVATETLTCDFSQHLLRISAHKSPLRRETYIVIVTCQAPPPWWRIRRDHHREKEPVRSTFFHLCVSRLGEEMSILRHTSTKPGWSSPWSHLSVCLSGYFLHVQVGESHIISDAHRERDGRRTREMRTIGLDVEEDITSFSGSSGAVVVLTDENIRVMYFE
ncbi:hypothetical protein B0H19DRAFT_1376902 [Mycena capillaripes]|nr:hypothetical protein B0H19DRAFT_1376902 [Mycena capillaripes]